MALISLTLVSVGAAATPSPQEHAGNGSVESVADAMRRDSIDAVDKRGNARLHYAAAAANLPVVEWLIANRANVNLLSQKYGTTALHELARAVTRDRTRIRDCVTRLLNAGANPNIADHQGEDALQAAARAGNATMVQVLLYAGQVEISAQSKQRALELAQQHSRIAVVSLLERDGVSSDTGKAIGIVNAAASGHFAMVERAIDSRTPLESTDAAGNTALQLAAGNGHADVVRLLLSRGAAPNTTNRQGQSALHLAAIQRHAVIVELLMAAGADVNLTSAAHGTAINAAAEREAIDIVKRLADAGATPASMHDTGQRAFGTGLALRLIASRDEMRLPAGETKARLASARASFETAKKLFENERLEATKRRAAERRKDMLIEAVAAGIATATVAGIQHLQAQQVAAGRRQIAQIAALRGAASYQDYQARYEAYRRAMINTETSTPYQIELPDPTTVLAAPATASQLDLVIAEYDRRIALTEQLLKETDGV